MVGYNRLSCEEREKIYLALGQGISLRSVAKQLGRSHSTIIREVRRNRSAELGYLPDRAQNLARSRYSGRQSKLDLSPELKECEKLKKDLEEMRKKSKEWEKNSPKKLDPVEIETPPYTYNNNRNLPYNKPNRNTNEIS